MKAISLITVILFVFNSCSYKMHKSITEDGNRVKNKEYKKTEKNTVHQLKNHFEYLHSTNSQERYNGQIEIDSSKSMLTYQNDSMIVYLDNSDSNYIELLLNGLIDPQPIYDFLVNRNLKELSWKEHSFTISKINRLQKIESSNKHMRFEIQVFLGKCPCFGPFQETFYLEITNNIKNNKNLNLFFNTSKITAFGN